MNKTKREILEKIRTGEVKMKPRWWFVAKIVGLRGIWWGLILMTALGISAVVYYWQIYEVAEVAEYGDIGWTILIQNFPYLWLMAALVGISGGVALKSRMGENYRKTTKVVLATTIIVVMLATVGLLWLGGLL